MPQTAIVATTSAVDAFAIRTAGFPRPPIVITPSASRTSGGAENFAARNPPSARPTASVRGHDGDLRQCATATADAKHINVASPSTVASEKCAITAGENANKASATLAAPSEKRRRAVNQRSAASSRPSATVTERV